ncbi:MAG: hypothetical protein AAGF57_03780 [Pseudomonadota bacterium]
MTQSSTEDCDCEHEDGFAERMHAQCCEIRRYQQDVMRNEGRSISQDEAALEWIERFAEAFAQEHDGQ